MQSAWDASFELLGEKESGGGGWLWRCFLGKLLQMNFAVVQTPGSLETQLLWPGEGMKVLGKGLVYTQGKGTM